MSILMLMLALFSGNAFSESIETEIFHQDGDHCEIWLDSFAVHKTRHYGMPMTQIVSVLKTHLNEKEIFRMGQVIQYKDLLDNQVKWATINADLDHPYTPHRIHFITKVHRPSSHVDRRVIQFANFIDRLEDDGTITRLWHSNHGKNFYINEVMKEPTYDFPLSYGIGTHSNEHSSLFYQKNACRD